MNTIGSLSGSYQNQDKDQNKEQHQDKPESKNEKILLGVSSCLLGEKVRYDGAHKKNNYILETLGKYFAFYSFCPEMAIGMGVPRETIRLVELNAGNDNAQVRVIGVKDPVFDVTTKLASIADDQADWLPHVFGYILKKGSPSCGMERVKQYRVTNAASNHVEIDPQEWTYHVEHHGTGLFAKSLLQNHPNLPLEEEGRLCDPVLRENFVNRVFAYKRWHDDVLVDPSWKAITDFHARHKWILFSHDQDKSRALGSELAQLHTQDLGITLKWYIAGFMQIMKIPATRKNHVNVLEHIRGYLKTEISNQDKAELSESIEDYRQGLLPLIVPLTLLRHHFRNHPDTYIERSWYLHPHPKQLMLLNQL